MNLSGHIIACLAAAASCLAAGADFGRYQPIVDRQMFGAPPPGFDPAKPPSEVSKASRESQKEMAAEQEKLKSSIRFSLLNVEADGTVMVGFSDNSEKPPRHYYLKVGEESGGWLVKSADPSPDERRVTLVKGEMEVELKLGDDSSGKADATKRVNGQSAPSAASAPDHASENMSLGGLRTSRRKARELENAQKAQERLLLQEILKNQKAEAERREVEAAERREKEEAERLERERRDMEETRRREAEAAGKPSTPSGEGAEGDLENDKN